MILITKFADGKVDDPHFQSRGISNMVQGTVGSCPMVVVPEEKQLAYSGYKDNIDSFLAATATEGRVAIIDKSYQLPRTSITFGLPYPRTVVSFRDLKPDNLKKVIGLIKAVGSVTPVENIAKHTNAFIWSGLDIEILEKIKPALQVPPVIKDTSSHLATLQAYYCYQCVELYLRLNTYPAFRDAKETRANVNFSKRNLYRDTYEMAKKRSRYVNVSMTHAADPNKGAKEQGVWLGEESDKNLEYDPAADFVHYASPPSDQSSISCGLPTSAPMRPGICFEYFEGMNLPDTNTLRNLMARFFLRCFPKGADGYMDFRKEIGGFASTPEGIAVTHILKGIEISLDAQAQLYVMMDGPKYLGFVVSGARWRIGLGQTWYLPLSATDLSAELEEIKTHSTSLASIISMLREEGVMVDDNLETAVELAEVLSSWDPAGTEDEIDEKNSNLTRMIGRINFKTKQVGLGPESIRDVLETIRLKKVEKSQHVYFPKASELALLGTTHGLALSRFGSKAPSFVVPKGTGGRVIRPEDFIGEQVKVKDALEKIPKIMIAERPFTTAVREFSDFMKSRKIFEGAKERQAEYKNASYVKDKKDMIVLAVANLASTWAPLPEDSAKEKKGATFDEDGFFSSL